MNSRNQQSKILSSLVIAVLVALYIGIPVDLVSLALTVVSILLTLEGGTSMVNCKDMVKSGAHGAAESILWKP